MKSKGLVKVAFVEKKIFILRGRKVLLDKDLAEIYGVNTRVLNQQVKRNKKKFPDDFMFRLNRKEYDNLRSQNVISSWGGSRYLPYVFTEYGSLMLATVLNSKTAIEASVMIVKAFVKMREILLASSELFEKLIALETKFEKHDKEIQGLFRYLRNFVDAAEKEKPAKIGFRQRIK